MATNSANRSNEEEFLFDLNSTPVYSDVEIEGSTPVAVTPSLEVDQLQEEDEDEDDPAASSENPEASNVQKKKRMLSNGERWRIYNALLSRSVNGKLKRDTTKEVSTIFSVSIQTVQRIWKRAKETPDGTSVKVSHRKGNCGRKRVQVDLNRVAAVPLRERTTLASLANKLEMSKTTLHRSLKLGLLRRHSNSIKPYLKEEHKRARLEFCMSMLEQNSLSHEPKFVGMYNMVHIDEKWFYMTKKCETYYLLPDEEEPLRTCQSKNYIGKVMFLVAMARPRFDDEGNEVFSGKIGVFPFITLQPAQRSSRNRDAGTLEIKPITSVKRETIKAYLIERVLPKVQEVWPREDIRNTIFIQQDNARTRVNPNDVEFHTAATKNGFDIRLVCQPSNSPDLNILDLGFFSAIQSLQHKTSPKTIEDLINAVRKSFDEYPTRKVDHVFLSLQLCMREIMIVRGSNKYKIPHINKTGLEKEGHLPKTITCDLAIVQNVITMLAQV